MQLRSRSLDMSNAVARTTKVGQSKEGLLQSRVIGVWLCNNKMEHEFDTILVPTTCKIFSFFWWF